jgi:hypothetical protein
LHRDTRRVAVVNIFSKLDPRYLEESHGVLRICRKGNPSQVEDVVVMDVKAIQSVMTIIPADSLGQGLWYVGYKPSSSIAKVIQHPEEDNEDEEDMDDG